jgi:PncC family amidohydrolase
MSEYEIELIKQAENKAVCVIEKLKKVSVSLTLAESCTCGLVSGFLASVPGASGILWGSFVCYTKEAKISMLGLDKNTLDLHGLVNRETALLMAEGALQKSGAGFAAAVTGLAGPDGDGSSVKVGTVWVSTAKCGGDIKAQKFFFTGSRNEIRLTAAIAVLESINENFL